MTRPPATAVLVLLVHMLVEVVLALFAPFVVVFVTVPGMVVVMPAGPAVATFQQVELGLLPSRRLSSRH